MAALNILRAGTIGLLAVALTGCSSDFNYGKVRGIIEGAPVRMDAEYVMLSTQQLECGQQNDLWDAPQSSGGNRFVARLTPKARELKFGDDVTIGEYRSPAVLVRGDFPLAVQEITSDKDGPEQFTKLVEAKVGVVINHSCFTLPLPIMGVRKGNFTQDVSPILLFRLNNGWLLEKFVH